MTLTTAVESYVRAQRSRGAVYQTIPFLLRSFVRSAGDIPVEQVSPEAIRTFCRGKGPPTRAQANKYSALRNFFRDLVARGHLSVSPVTDPPPRVQRNFEPHIYSREEVQRLLDATHILQNRSHALRPRPSEHSCCCSTGLACDPARPGDCGSATWTWENVFSGCGTRNSSSRELYPSARPYARSCKPTAMPARPCRPHLATDPPSQPPLAAAHCPLVPCPGPSPVSGTLLASATRRRPAGNRASTICAIIPSPGLFRVRLGSSGKPSVFSMR